MADESATGVSEDFDPGAVAKAVEELFAIFPGETEGADVGHAERLAEGRAAQSRLALRASAPRLL
jgi:hypothetical protein